MTIPLWTCSKLANTGRAVRWGYLRTPVWSAIQTAQHSHGESNGRFTCDLFATEKTSRTWVVPGVVQCLAQAKGQHTLVHIHASSVFTRWRLFKGALYSRSQHKGGPLNKHHPLFTKQKTVRDSLAIWTATNSLCKKRQHRKRGNTLAQIQRDFRQCARTINMPFLSFSFSRKGLLQKASTPLNTTRNALIYLQPSWHHVSVKFMNKHRCDYESIKRITMIM